MLVCEGRQSPVGHFRVHSTGDESAWNPTSTLRALVEGAPKRVNVCTGCLKAGKVTKAGLVGKLRKPAVGASSDK